MNGIFPNDHASVNALVVSGGDVYAGGNFTTAGSDGANYVAKWNGSNWSALGSGVGGFRLYFSTLNAMAVSGGEVYAGGQFNYATGDGNQSYNIAKWNGTSWTNLGSGINGYVFALAVSGSNVYAGGGFTTAGGIPATNIAKWDGNSWTNLGSGISASPDYPYYGGGVYALAMSGSALYAGGNFSTAGDNPIANIAKWDGTNWSALGSGLSGYRVFALAVSGSNLYAGGSFTTTGGIPATNIAKWDGNSWSALGSSINGQVNALAVSGSDLYAGGYFTTAGGSAANYIAKWDGTSWSALGSGMNMYGAVSALAVSGSDLYAGGDFTAAGGKVSAYVARAIVNPPVLAIVPDGLGGYFLRFSGVPGSDYRLQRAPLLHGPWATSSPQTAPASGFLEFWDVFPPPGQGFYRTAQP